MIRYFTLILILISSWPSSAQMIDTIYFNNNYTRIARVPSNNPVYKLTGNKISYGDKTAKIILPDGLNMENLAFSYFFFPAEKKGKFRNITTLLLDGYNDFRSNIYVDYNQNLDFTDDGSPLALSGINDSIIIEYQNSSKAKMLLRQSIQFATYRDQQDKHVVEQFYLNHENGKGNKFLESKYWLTYYSYNNLTTNKILNGDTIQIGICDWIINGSYNDKYRDRVLTAENEFNLLSFLQVRGGYIYKDNTIIKLKNRYYKILDIEKDGKFIVLQETKEKPANIQVGDEVPNLQVKLIDGSTKNLHELLDPNKYNLLDFWGTWCKPCVKQTPKLLRLDSLYGSKLNIIALNHNDKKKKIEAYIAKNNIPWINGFSNKELHNTFLVDGWPFLVLIDNNKKIVFLRIPLYMLEEYIQGFTGKASLY